MKEYIAIIIVTAILVTLFNNSQKKPEIQKAYQAGYQNAQMNCRKGE